MSIRPVDGAVASSDVVSERSAARGNHAAAELALAKRCQLAAVAVAALAA